MADKTPAEILVEKLGKSKDAPKIKAANVAALVERMKAVHGRIQELASQALHAEGPENDRLLAELNCQIEHAVKTYAAIKRLDKSKIEADWKDYDA
jgi:hypothetical protein